MIKIKTSFLIITFRIRRILKQEKIKLLIISKIILTIMIKILNPIKTNIYKIKKIKNTIKNKIILKPYHFKIKP